MLQYRRYSFPAVFLFAFALFGQTQSRTAPRAGPETLVLDGKQPVFGAYHKSDPSLLNVNGKWTVLFTTIGWRPTCSSRYRYDYTIRQTVAELPTGSDLGATPDQWRVASNGQGGYAEFVTPGPDGSWDQDAVEAPKAVSGFDPVQGRNVVRIYYTGWKRVQTGTDEFGCPIFGYRDWNIGMAELKATGDAWVKRPAPVLEGANPWEQLHYYQAGRPPLPYKVLGDQTVVYVPGTGQNPGTWHMYYEATTDYPTLRIVTVHAVSRDGVSWPASDRFILDTHPPFRTDLLPGGPYSIDVAVVGGRYYFVGWLPNPANPPQQGLWMVSSSTPDGSAPGDFSDWKPLVYDNNGVWWHSASPELLDQHQAGLFAPALAYENSQLWVYFSGVRQDSEGLWTSLGRALVDPTVLQ
jgi:hypothetical protein